MTRPFIFEATQFGSTHNEAVAILTNFNVSALEKRLTATATVYANESAAKDGKTPVGSLSAEKVLTDEEYSGNLPAQAEALIIEQAASLNKPQNVS